MELIGDFHTSVAKALSEIDENWRAYDGLIVCGTHSPHDVEEVIQHITYARVNNKPFLGICFGHQLAALEFVRDFVGNKDAIHAELSDKGWALIAKDKKGLKVGMGEVKGWWGEGNESYWRNYYVKPHPALTDYFECVVQDGAIEAMRLKNHPHFVGVQFHPEYQSSGFSPHPILVNFLNLCRGNAGGRRHSAN